MKHVRFGSIQLVAYKHSLFIQELIYKGITMHPEIAENISRLSIDCYVMPCLDELLSAVEFCNLKELHVKFNTVSKVFTNTKVLRETQIESMSIICPNYENNTEFPRSLLESSPHLKHCELKLKRIGSYLFRALQHCHDMESLCLTFESADYHPLNIYHEPLINFIRATKLKHIKLDLVKQDEHLLTGQVLQEMTQSWADTLETLSVHAFNHPFQTDPKEYTLTRCKNLKYVELCKNKFTRYWYHEYNTNIPQVAWVEKILREVCTTSLRTLKLFDVFAVQGARKESFENMASLQKLKSLDICGVGGDQFKVIIEQIDSLDELKLVSPSSDETEALSIDSIAQICPNLKSLIYGAPRHISSIDTFKRLNTLELIINPSYTINVRQKTYDLKEVKTLRLKVDAYYSIEISKKQMVYNLVSSCPNLEHLSIGQVTYRTNGPSYHELLATALPMASALKTLRLQVDEFRVPCDVKFKSMVAFSNSVPITKSLRKDFINILAWIIVCDDINEFKLEEFISKEMVTEILQELIDELELCDEEDDIIAVWSLFMHVVEKLGKVAYDQSVLGDKSCRDFGQFVKFAVSIEQKLKTGGQTFEGKRGWELSLLQLYTLIQTIYPDIKGSTSSFGFF